ncbi:MAG: hypothetical protein LUH02_07430 [Erysipelotrichaceae bacterium]|nr:hypothetical protein [Erysipelotrichaceae bacterium]
MGTFIRKIRRSQILYVLVIIALIAVLGLLIYIYQGSGQVENDTVELELQSESVTIEYGESISLDAADYLNALKVDEEVIEATTVSTDAIYETYDTVDEDGEETTGTYDYPAVGEYTITLTYEDLEATVALKVQDTTAPEFINLEEEYELTDGETLDVSQFSAKDFSTITITLEDDDVDYATAGTYTATLKAVDIYDNETTAEITVIINIEEVEEEEEETTTSTSTNSTTSSSSRTNSSSSSNKVTKKEENTTLEETNKTEEKTEENNQTEETNTEETNAEENTEAEETEDNSNEGGEAPISEE